MPRSGATLLLLLVALAVPAWPGVNPPPTTVFFKFEGLSSPAVFSAMKQEMSALFRSTGHEFDWRRIEEASEIGPVANLVVMRLRGDCRMTHPFPPLDEQGLFAWTEVSDGVVLPFSTVDCDRVRNAVSAAMWGGDRARGEFLMGRALGRILAHELFHIFTRSGVHGPQGVARRALTGAELIAEGAVFHPEDLHRIPSVPASAPAAANKVNQ